MCEGNYSSLHRIAQALTQLQATYGPAREVKGKGVAAAQLQRMLSRYARPHILERERLDKQLTAAAELNFRQTQLQGECCHAFHHRPAPP